MQISLKILVFFVRFFVWFFVITTVMSVGFASIGCAVYPDSQQRIMASGGGDNVISSWGLTYTGWGGAALGAVQVIVVLWALRASRTRKVAYRRTGHIILILWAGLWTANAFYVFGNGTFGLIYVMSFFLLCTCVRALLGLRTLIAT